MSARSVFAAAVAVALAASLAHLPDGAAAAAALATPAANPLATLRQRPVQPFTTRPTTTPVPPMVETSTLDPCECGKGIKCMCVMYYLCNLKTNTIYLYGEDVLDERFGGAKVETCPGTLQVCCRVPPELLSGVEPGGVEVPPPPPLPGPSTPPKPELGTSSTPTYPNYETLPVPGLPTDDGTAVSSEPPPREGPAEPLPPAAPRWECGVRRTDFALLDSWARVDDRDSEEVAFAEFPWTLVVMRDDDGSWLGGASLISPRVALTAAHNVHQLKASELRVRAGEWDATTTDEPLAHQERRVAALLPHPGFVRRSLFNDAALLQLEAPFDAAPHVAPVCLPSPSAAFDGRRCLATGWGADGVGKAGSLRRLLRRVDLPVVPRSDCQERLRTTRLGVFFHLHDSFMCAGSENGKDTCKGDGGGPLVCQSLDDPRRYEQAGIVSWGIGCADPKVPSVYTDVSKLRPWIDQQLEALDPASPS